MTPHGDTDIEAVAERLVILVQHLATFVDETQHRRMHDDVVGAAILCVQRQLENRIEVLVRHRHDDTGLAAALVHGNFEVALAFVETHGEELSLLARDEQPLDVEVVNPVPDIRAQASFVQRQVVIERVQSRGPYAAHVFARIVLGIELRVVNGDTPLL